MKKIFSIIMMSLCFSALGMAQTNDFIVYIHLHSGPTYECHLSDITKVTFDKNTLTLELVSGKKEIPAASIESTTFKSGDYRSNVTAIEDVKDVEKKGDGKMYTLDGKVVKDVNNLPSGIYIKNGKKYHVIR